VPDVAGDEVYPIDYANACLDVADDESLSYGAKITAYLALANEHVESDRHWQWCGESLADLPGGVHDWVSSPDFDRLIVETGDLPPTPTRIRPSAVSTTISRASLMTRRGAGMTELCSAVGATPAAVVTTGRLPVGEDLRGEVDDGSDDDDRWWPDARRGTVVGDLAEGRVQPALSGQPTVDDEGHGGVRREPAGSQLRSDGLDRAHPHEDDDRRAAPSEGRPVHGAPLRRRSEVAGHDAETVRQPAMSDGYAGQCGDTRGRRDTRDDLHRHSRRLAGEDLLHPASEDEAVTTLEPDHPLPVPGARHEDRVDVDLCGGPAVGDLETSTTSTSAPRPSRCAKGASRSTTTT